MRPKNLGKNDILFDAKLLSDFIYELNISRRIALSYPEGHPMIQEPVKKALGLLAKLMGPRDEITLGVARNTLIFDQNHLDKKNPVYQDYAAALFKLGIIAVTFARNLDEGELLQFNRTLRMRRAEAREKGGIQRVLDEEGVRGIRVQGIEQGLFRTIEEDQIQPPSVPRRKEGKGSIWKSFVEGIMAGTLNPSGKAPSEEEENDPQLLSDLLNQKDGEIAPDRNLDYDQVIATYMRHALGEEGEKRKALLEKFSAFVSGLNPRLRRQFLSGTFRSLASHEELPDEVFAPFPGEIILEALQDLNARNLSASPFILRLLQKLGRTSSSEREDPLVTRGMEEKEKLGEMFKAIFQEDHLAAIVPPAYEETLRGIMGIEEISGLELPELGNLKKSLEGAETEIQTCMVIMEIMRSGLAEDQIEFLKRNLAETIDYWMETGDFGAINELCDRTKEPHPVQPGGPQERLPQILGALATPELIGSVLKSLSVWGKGKYPGIQELIRKVGEPFIEPMLDRLADASSLSIRRFCLNRLIEMGNAVRRPALRRLQDHRWYFVRNLLLLLRHVGDASVLPHLRRLLKHSHPKVRQEAAKLIRHFDSQIEKQGNQEGG